MSIPKRPFPYRPDEYFDFGLAGEHPVEMMAWIDESNNVSILYVKVLWTFKNPIRQETDITEQVLKCHREKYEDEIKRAYLNARETELESAV